MLEVKYHVLLLENDRGGGSFDCFHWSAILRAASAHPPVTGFIAPA